MVRRPFNPLTVAVLQQVLDSERWIQNDLADRTDISRATASQHLSHQRPVRDKHLVSYLNAMPNAHDRQRLLAAWLRDVLGKETVGDVLNQEATRVSEAVAEWAPALTTSDRSMLAWLGNEIANDPDLAEMMRSICRRLGYDPK